MFSAHWDLVAAAVEGHGCWTNAVVSKVFAIFLAKNVSIKSKHTLCLLEDSMALIPFFPFFLIAIYF